VAAYNKFNQFVQDLGSKVHNLASDSLVVALFNTTPNAADIKFNLSAGPPPQLQSTSNVSEIAAGNGYTLGGTAAGGITYTGSGGTSTLQANQVVFTAAGGTIGPFRYVVLYNVTALAAATRPVISWWDYGSSLTLNAGDSFTVQFNSVSPGTIFTLVCWLAVAALAGLVMFHGGDATLSLASLATFIRGAKAPSRIAEKCSACALSLGDRYVEKGGQGGPAYHVACLDLENERTGVRAPRNYMLEVELGQLGVKGF
jgi:hypothetical protein